MRWEDRWDDSVLGTLEDLEMQAAGLHLADRAIEVDELSVAQYAEVELVSRLHGSVGSALRVGTTEGLDLHGSLAETGSDWLRLEDGHGGAWVVHLPFVATVGGLADRSVPAAARPLPSRLSLRSVLRGLAADRQPAVVHARGGRVLHGTLGRVGADFVEVRQGGGEPVTVPLSAVVVVQGRPVGP